MAGGIVRSGLYNFFQRKQRQLPSLRLDLPQADCLWRLKRALQATGDEKNENGFWENLSFGQHPASSTGKLI